MSVTAIVGAQWGDEGKGRVVDYVAQKADLVIRFQGGDNAGHTVKNDAGEFALHMIPSGIFNPQTQCVVGAGTVVNPSNLLEEMAMLQKAGLSLDNLWIDRRAHVVLPIHPELDGLKEARREESKRIGTTKRGIGPAYTDKASRVGVRMGDLLRPAYLKSRIAESLPLHNRTLADFGQSPIDIDDTLAGLAESVEKLRSRIIDTLPMVRRTVRERGRVLLEGQLGVMRDLDWGIYPFTTSSNPIVGAACAGAGIPPTAINDVLGVVKVYSTSVGGGPFPVELFDGDGEKLRKVGHEFGATTGRPRRCGWFDAVAIRHASWINGFTALALTKVDVLDSFEEIKVCTGYRLGGEILEDMPDTPDLDEVKPVYETWPGWNCSTREARHWDELPGPAQNYLKRLSELAGVPIRYVSVGPERSELLVIESPEDT